MEKPDVVRLGLILAAQAEIEGMKAENTQREMRQESLAYTNSDFCDKAEELRNMSYRDDSEIC